MGGRPQTEQEMHQERHQSSISWQNTRVVDHLHITRCWMITWCIGRGHVTSHYCRSCMILAKSYRSGPEKHRETRHPSPITAITHPFGHQTTWDFFYRVEGHEVHHYNDWVRGSAVAKKLLKIIQSQSPTQGERTSVYLKIHGDHARWRIGF